MWRVSTVTQVGLHRMSDPLQFCWKAFITKSQYLLFYVEKKKKKRLYHFNFLPQITETVQVHVTASQPVSPTPGYLIPNFQTKADIENSGFRKSSSHKLAGYNLGVTELFKSLGMTGRSSDLLTESPTAGSGGLDPGGKMASWTEVQVSSKRLPSPDTSINPSSTPGVSRA